MGIRKRLDNFFTSLIGNEASYQFYYDTIKEMAISRFEWNNLPDEVDARFLELMLFERGAVVFFNGETVIDGELKDAFICLPFAQKRGFTIYRKPVSLEAFAVNGARWSLENFNSVIIYNNVIRTSGIGDAEIFARRLSQIDRTIDVNIHAQKTPVLIRCDEHERLSLQNLYMKYDGNQPVIYGDRNLSTQPISVIDTKAPFVAPELFELKIKIWNELLTKLGISNISYQKKERMISDEVQRGQGGTIAQRYSGLLMRQQAAEEINRMFGLNVTVSYRQDEIDNDLIESPEDESEVIE